jgi:polygalacturonase
MSKYKYLYGSVFFLALATAGCSLSASSQPPAGNRDFDIGQFGAVSDTTKLSTVSINRAIEACSRAGGGRVIIPAGHYKSGTITLLDNVELYLQRGAILYGSTQHADYPRQRQPRYRSQKDPGGWYALIYAEGARNIGISGPGIIDGQGASQLPRVLQKGQGVDDRDGRPRNILLISCKDISIQEITLQNSGIWNQHYLDCENLFVRNIRVYNHSNRNNDGIDLDGCRHVILSNSILDSDDDCITLKSTGPAACEDIVITGCIASSFCNAIKCGTESTGGFKNILISDCIVRPSSCPTEPIFKTPRTGQTGIALEIVDGGIMDGVIVSNILIEGTECPIFVRLGNRARKYIPEAPDPPFGKMRNISISGITADNTGNSSCSITGVPGASIENISLEHIRLTNKGGLKEGQYIADISQVPELETAYPEPSKWGNLPSYGFFIRHVKEISLNDIRLSSREKETRVAILADDVDELFVSRLRTDGAEQGSLRLNNVRSYKKI